MDSSPSHRRSVFTGKINLENNLGQICAEKEQPKKRLLRLFLVRIVEKDKQNKKCVNGQIKLRCRVS